MSFLEELKRRNVFRVGIAYAVAAWIILQATDVIGEILDLPQWGGKLILLVLGIGFILALILAWAYELTPEGVKRETEVDRSQSITRRTGRKLDFAIISLLALGLVYFFWEARLADRSPADPSTDGAVTVEASAPEPGTGAPPGDLADGRSIAVLPFTNRSPNEDDIYFTDGVHDDLLTQLAKLNSLSVISRTSVMEYRDTEKKIGDIAGELGVANIMEGAVQRAGSRVRINVQLIDAATDEHLWAEIYDRELTTENLFEIQSEIAQNIAQALHATLTEEEIATVAAAPTGNVEAYELYQRARRFALGESEIGYETAIELYEEAIALDPEFALAWLGLAKAHLTNFWQYGGHAVDRTAARTAIDRARAINDDLPELYLAEGFYWYWGHLDYSQAIENIERAIERMPGNAEAHMWLGWAKRRDGQWDEAIASMRESLRLDPLATVHCTELSTTETLLDEHEQALATAQSCYDMAPDNYWARATLGVQQFIMTGDLERTKRLMVGAQYTGDPWFIGTYIAIHKFDVATESVLEAIELFPDDATVQRSSIEPKSLSRASTYFNAGATDLATEQAREAMGTLEELARSVGEDDYRIAEARARASAILGDPEGAASHMDLAWTNRPVDAVDDVVLRYKLARTAAMAGLDERALELLQHELESPGYQEPPSMRQDPHLASLHDDPRFIALMERFE